MDIATRPVTEKPRRRSARSRRSLRWAILWRYLVAGTVPILLAGLLIRGYVATRQAEEIEARNLLLARSTAAACNEFLSVHSSVLDQAGLLLRQVSGAATAEEILETMVRDTRLFGAVYLVGGDGRIEQILLDEDLSDRQVECEGLDLSTDPAIAAVRTTGQPVWSRADLFFLFTDRQFLRYSIPLEGGRILEGVVDLAPLRKVAERVSRGPSVGTSVIDASGTLFIHPDRVLAEQHVSMRDRRPVQEGLAGREGTYRFEENGSEWLGSVARIETTGWLVLVSQQAADAFAPVRRVETLTLVGLSLAVVLAAAGAFWLASRVTRPLRTLAASATEVAGGRYDIPIPAQRYAEVEALAGSLRDMAAAVGEREVALRGRERLLRTTFEQVAVGIVNADLEGRLLRVNQMFSELLGYAPEELLGRHFQEITHPDDLGRDLELVAELLAGRIPLFSMDKRYIRKGGRPVWAAITVSLQRDEEGEPEYLIGVVQDISARKRVEAENLELEEQLRHSQKLEAIGQLAGGVAHDFNNQLTVIEGYTELLMTRLPGADEMRALEQIRRAGHRARTLTSQLLAFGRKQVLRPRVLTIASVLSDMKSPLARMVGEDVEISLVVRVPCGRARLDRTQLEQAILNLAINARDAMPRGGRLVLEAGDLDLAGADARALDLAPGPYVEIRVSDTGTGMDAETLAQVFEPFFTTKEVGKGTGLGLSMVYGFVRQSAGSVRVDSSVGEGATFRLLFPRSSAPEEKSRELVQLDVEGGTEMVLLAEDEPAVRSYVADALRRRGYGVLDSGGSAEALEASRGHEGTIDLLVTDVVMPGLSGPRLAERLIAERPGLKILYITGYAEERVLLEGGAETSAHVLNKPFAPDQLAAAVREALDDYSQTTSPPGHQ